MQQDNLGHLSKMSYEFLGSIMERGLKVIFTAVVLLKCQKYAIYSKLYSFC